MSSEFHIIRHYTFDVRFSEKTKAYSLQDRISALFRDRLAADTERLITQLVPENMIAVVDKLELDLGNILLKDLDQELPVKLLEALEKALNDVLNNNSVSGDQFHMSGPLLLKKGDDRLLDWLHHYLLTGSLPWWATAAERTHPEHAVLQLAAAAPAKLAAFLRRAAQADYVRRRIAWQFSPKAIQAVIEVLEPSEAAFIFAYSKEITQIQQQRQVLQTEGATLEKAVALFVLSYLITESSSRFNRRQFVRSQLAQLANHYNVSYEKLLQLFYDALGFYNQPLKDSGIAVFINSLYEESTGLPATGASARRLSRRTANQQIATDADAIEEQLAILRYYLQHGSFPWWAPPVSLAVLYTQLRQLAKDAATPLQQLLTSVLKQEQAWKRWVEIITAGRPAIAQTGEQELSFKRWLGAMSTTSTADSLAAFFEPGSHPYSQLEQGSRTRSRFEQSDYPRSHSDLGSRLEPGGHPPNHLEPGSRLPGGFVASQDGTQQASSADRTSSARQSFVSGEQFSAAGQQASSADKASSARQAFLSGDQFSAADRQAFFSKEQSSSAASQTLRDIILYRLTYGSVPWWGSTYAHFSLNSLLQQLMEQSPAQAIAVFKYASTVPAAMERFISSVEIPLFFTIARRAGLPATVEEVYESAYTLLQVISDNIAPSTPGQALQLTLIKALWQTWSSTGYRSLELPAFIDKAINLWAATIQIIPGSLLLLMKNTLPAIKSMPGRDWLATHLQQLLSDHTVEWEADLHTINREWEQAASMGYHPILLLVRKGIVPATIAETTATAHTLVEWLRTWLATGQLPALAGRLTYLTDNQLPQLAGTLTPQETSWLAVKMLEWLYANQRDILPGVAAIIEPASAILSRLFELWQLSSATHAPIQELVGNWLEQAITPPSSGTMIVRDGLWQEITAEQPVPSPAAQRTSLTAAASRLLHRLRQYETLTPFTEQQHWLEQAIQLVTHYLTWHQLPDHLGTVNNTITQELLKQSVWILFREKPGVLQTLFSSSNGPVAARMQVYNLFATPAGIQEMQLRESLEKYALQDSLLLLQETATHSVHRPIAGFKEAIQYYRQQSRQDRLSFYKKVFQHTVLIQHAAQQLDDEAFLEMMQDIDIGWGHPATAALKELQHLFDRVITDSLEREKIRILFRQFHIMMLAGHFSLHNARAYSQRFLEFIVANGHSGVQSLTGHLAVMENAIPLSSYQHLRNILPALQQQAIQQLQAYTQLDAIQQQLYTNDMQRLDALDAIQQQQLDADVIQQQLHITDKQQLDARDAIQQQQHITDKQQLDARDTIQQQPPTVDKQRLDATNPNDQQQLIPKQPLPPATEPERQEVKPLKKPAPETIYVTNAGLVLVHPFLSFAFQHLQYTKAGQFVDQAAQFRAVHFLQYLAKGQEQAPEHELVLNKVLCNLPLEEPIPLDIVLTDVEKELSIGLIKAVIQQWDKMKNSSVEGFQGAFLQREGALHETEESWYLRVEQRGYDVIMQTLPWGLGMIKTSWMTKMLHTEWIYV